MSAFPLVPGLLYRVSGPGFTSLVAAGNPADAMCIGIDILSALRGE